MGHSAEYQNVKKKKKKKKNERKKEEKRKTTNFRDNATLKTDSG